MEGRLGVRKGAWTEEEDNLLRKCVEKYGETKWHQVPERAGLNRCRKSCRLRWLNYLKPGIKRGEFAAAEIDLILRLHKLLGNRWSLIAGRLPGRTANDVKNYWNTHLRKKLPYAVKKFEGQGAHDRTYKKINVIKPRARTISKNSPWLVAKRTNLNNQQSANHNLCELSTAFDRHHQENIHNKRLNLCTLSSPFDRQQQENIETEWWERLLAEKESDCGICSLVGWQGGGAIVDLWGEKSPSGSAGTKLEHSFVEAGQNCTTDDFSLDVELWDVLNSGQEFDL